MATAIATEVVTTRSSRSSSCCITGRGRRFHVRQFGSVALCQRGKRLQVDVHAATAVSLPILVVRVREVVKRTTTTTTTTTTTAAAAAGAIGAGSLRKRDTNRLRVHPWAPRRHHHATSAATHMVRGSRRHRRLTTHTGVGTTAPPPWHVPGQLCGGTAAAATVARNGRRSVQHPPTGSLQGPDSDVGVARHDGLQQRQQAAGVHPVARLCPTVAVAVAVAVAVDATTTTTTTTKATVTVTTTTAAVASVSTETHSRSCVGVHLCLLRRIHVQMWQQRTPELQHHVLLVHGGPRPRT